MEASQLPIGQTVTITDNESIKGTITRTSEESGIFEQFDKTSGDLILRTKLGIKDGSAEIEHINFDFWTVMIDGNESKSIPGGMNYSFSLKPESKLIEIKTKYGHN